MWIKANGDSVEDETLKQFIANKNDLIYVGTDSHSYGNFWLFATVICCYKPGNGGIFFTKRIKIPKNEIKTLVDRLLHEAHLSIEAAQEVEKNFYLEQSTTSHHLNTLKRAGITKSRKEGRNIYYSIDYDTFSEIWNQFAHIVFD